MPTRSFGGTDGFQYSGCKIVEDPFTENPVILVPALNPDVSIIHVHQADEFGNARVFGTGIAHQECALASKRVIVSAEEIVSTDEIRRDPARTSIPHFAVDAVVHAPFGAYPGTVQGYYASDPAGVIEAMGAMFRGDFREYLKKHVYSVQSHDEYLEKVVGTEKARRDSPPRNHPGGLWLMSTPATDFNEREFVICQISRLVEDKYVYWVGGGGEPLSSVLLAKRSSAPNLQYLTEDGVVGPEALVPFDPLMTMISSRANYRALQWGTMNYAADLAHLGYVDYGILNTLQVDRYGNINSTVVGKYEGGEGRRFGGPGRRRQYRRAGMAHDPGDRSAKAQIRRSGRFHLIAGISGRAGAREGSTVFRPAPGPGGSTPHGRCLATARLPVDAGGGRAVRHDRTGAGGNEFQTGYGAEGRDSGSSDRRGAADSTHPNRCGRPGH